MRIGRLTIQFALAALLTGAVVAGPALAQTSNAPSKLIPERRSVLLDGFDLPGNDLRSLFDTTLAQCEKACLADSACTAFTYNTRNASCFPKSAAGTPTAYTGAVSGTLLAAKEGAAALAAERAGDLRFLPARFVQGAKPQAQGLGQQYMVSVFSAEELRRAAIDAEGAGSIRQSMQLWGAATALGDTTNDWLEYARLLERTGQLDENSKRSYAEFAVQANVNAYLRAPDTATRHNALAQMATPLETIGYGRNAVGALRQAFALQARDDTGAALERMAALYGLRITDHRVESDLAVPKICAVFSEQMIDQGFDYTPFVQVPEPGITIEPGNWGEICAVGVKHGQRVTLTFREGMPSADGQTLRKSAAITAYVRDRAPQVNFSGGGFVLPKGNSAALPVVSVNAPKLELELYSLSDRSLIDALRNGWLGRPMEEWDGIQFAENSGEKIWSGNAEVTVETNRDVTTRLPLDEALKGRPAGIYALKARAPGVESYENPASWQWFVISDLGLTSLSGVDGLTVIVRSLGDAGPKVGAKVEVLARSNRVLATGTTDDQGVARFDSKFVSGTGGAQPALITVTQGDDDIAFLSLSDPEFDLSDRGVTGRDASPPIDMFLATERGAYRAGETLHATALARNGESRALVGLPLTALLRRPDGVEHSRQRITDTGGGFVISAPISANAPRGNWRLEILADPDAGPIALKTFLVEDFLPERIDFDLKLPEGPVLASEPAQIDLDVRYLFGAPGAGLAIEGESILRATPALVDYPDYTFGMADARFDPTMTSIEGAGMTDDDGKAQLTVTLPEFQNAGLPLEVTYVVRVAESSGRPVERRITRPLKIDEPMIGIKPLFDGVAPENGQSEFSVIAVGESGDMAVNWRLDRIETRYQWYSIDGDWNWEPITSRAKVSEGSTTISAVPSTIGVTTKWGEYELTVATPDGKSASSRRFAAGWFAPADATRSPDTLELSLDQPNYAHGDTAKLRIVPRAAGTALISVLSNRVIALKAVEVTEGENIIELPVTDEWGAGVYVTASVLRPMDAPAGRLPGRAMGLAHAAIAPGDRQLTATFETPAESAPRAPLEIALKVDGIKPGEKAWATIAAVDLGILNLTGFKAPDPSAHYFGQRKLGVGIRDIYGRLIDGLNGAEGIVRSGGDAASPKLQANPPTEELVAWFEGPIEVGADGYARSRFDLPSFNGTVRVMGIVWSDSAVGQAQSDVLVRDPVVVTASLPRYLQPGDESRLLLEIVHASGPAGRMSLDVTADGVTLGPVPSGVDLAEGGKAVLSIPVSASRTGLMRLETRLTTPDGKVLTKPLNLPVEVNDPDSQRVTRLEIAPGKTVEIDTTIFAEFREGVGHALISAGSLARFDAPGLLQSLDAYPWGCTEQLTSRALPLLYFDQVAEAMGIEGGDTARQRIGETITEVLLNQTAEGGFGLWSASSGTELWLDAYVTDFLSRARAQGHTVPDRAMRSALDNLRSQVNYAGDFEKGGEALAYALMVLAREGAAAIGDLRYYADVKAEAFSTPLALAQLATGLALYGDQPRSDKLFARAGARATSQNNFETDQIWRADFGTYLRDTAGVLALALESGSSAIDREIFANRIAAVAGRRALSTQEQAWILMAAHGMVGTTGAEGLSINGTPVQGALVRRYDGSEGKVSITNNGAQPAILTISAFGKATGDEAKTSIGYSVSRAYYTMEGAPADITSVKAGTRLVAVLTVKPHGQGEARLLVEDPLPAGLEIDNPNLMQSGQIAALDWLTIETNVAHSEFRQERFMAALERRGNDQFSLAYILRAVSPGDFHHPAASVEDMYRPNFRGLSDSGRVTVTE